MSSRTTKGQEPDGPALDHIERLCADGLYLQAYERTHVHGPLQRWHGLRARLVAGHLADNLGDPRLATVLFFLAWREHPTDARALLAYAHNLGGRRGPYACWRFLQRHADLEPADARRRSEWLALHAAVLAALRDFGGAEAWLARAEAVAPAHPWVRAQGFRVLVMQDRWEEALPLGRRILEIRPWYLPGVEETALALVQCGHTQDALHLLREAAQRLESGRVMVQLVRLLIDQQRWDEASEAIERAAILFPLLRGNDRHWIEAARSDIAYHRGDRVKAIQHARAAGKTGFFQEIAERLSANACDCRAVLLDVPYVHQHFRTCAPATLASIGQYWSMPVDHLEVAETICYGGTPDHKEREWAEANGWMVREFTVTWDVASALLDRGVPFTLTTVQPTAAHLQAVIGYDAARGTFVIRDPSGFGHREYLARELLDAQRSTGPRGMALVPLAEAGRLDGIDLPEAALYDHWYALRCALDRHDRAAAWSEYEQLARQYPGHAFVHRARWAVAAYDADRPAMLDCVERLLEQFPGDQLLCLRKLGLLRELGRREDRLRLLRQLRSRRDADPVFSLQYAEELQTDARNWPEVERLLLTVMRRCPQAAPAYGALAALRVGQRRFEEALELHRFAACLAPTDEGFAQRFAAVAQLLKRSDDAITVLRERHRRLGTRSCAPAVTLYTALANLGRQTEAFLVLDDALAQRPDDEMGLLFTAQEAARFGDRGRAEGLLEKAQGRVRRNGWMRASARVAEALGDWQRARVLWGELAEIECTAVDAHQAVTELMTRTEGAAAGCAYLGGVASRLPHHLEIQHLYARRLRTHDPEECARALEALLVHHPTDAWAWRELALVSSMRQRHDTARRSAEEALRLDPNSTASHAVSGSIAAATGLREEAQTAFRTAIRLAVDNTPAVHGLMQLCQTRQQAAEALHFLQRELECQTVFGDALQTYREVARAFLPAGDVLSLLQAALAARPDLAQAWSQAIRQLLDMERVDEAAALCRQATERFPLSAELWVDRAHVEQARGDRPARLEALERAVAIAPTYDGAVRLLAAAYEAVGNLPAAQRVLETAVGRTPQDPANHACLGEVLWKQGEHEAACERLRQGLRSNPGYTWGWAQLRRWLTQLGHPDGTETLARTITGDRAGDPEAWLALARELQSADASDERLAALDRALELQPRKVDAHDLLATVLAETGRFDDSLAACAPAVFDGAVPLELRGRQAWVEHRRGNLARAVELIKETLEVHPAYTWGWQKLADWAAQTGDLAGALHAAERLVRLEPGNATAWGYLGDARTGMGDSEGARRALRRAFAMEPDYLWAGLNLFDAEMREGRVEEAAAVLAELSWRSQSDAVLLRAVALAAVRDDSTTALEHFRRQCESPGEGLTLQSSWDTLCQHGWVGAADAALSDIVLAGQPSPRAATLWVRRCVTGQHWRACEDGLVRLLERHEVGVPATAQYITALHELKAHPRLLRFADRAHLLWRQHTPLWGVYGDVLAQMRRYAQCVEWMADWRERQDARAWMLISLVAALRHLDGWVEARAVGLHAATLAAPETEAKAIAPWLAVDDALAGNAADCDRRIAGISPDGLSPYYRCLHALATGVREVERAEPRDRRRVFRDVRVRIARALRAETNYANERALQLAVRRSARRIADCCGDVRSRLWAWGCRLPWRGRV